MAVTYFAILTSIGAAKLANASALGTTLQITQMVVGDGGGNVPVPDANRTTLVNEVRRAPLNQLKIDPSNSSQIIAEQVIPETVGGWWIREIGLLDNTGALIAIANCAPSYKPLLAEGSGRTQTVRMVLIVNNTGAVELKIDPSVVLATREYVDTAIVTAINRQDAKASVRAATTANIVLNGLPTVDGVVLVAGDRVLVKNQNTGSQNGLYVAAAGAWARSQDADENAEVTPSLTVSVESGATQADTIWQLITDAPIVVGTTALVFQDITNGLARLASPAFYGVPIAPTAAPGTNTQQLATAAFVQTAIADKAPLASPALSGSPTAPTAGKNDNSTLLATTAYALGMGLRAGTGLQVVQSNTTLLPSSAGNHVISNQGAGAVNVALPLCSSVPVGTMYIIEHNSAAMSSFAIGVQGADTLVLPGTTANLAPYVMAVGEVVIVENVGSVWKIVAGNGAKNLVNGGGFSSLLGASSGYQKLPSGMIIQWGTTTIPSGSQSVDVTLPIAAPSTLAQVVLTDAGSGSIPLGAALSSLTKFTAWRAGQSYNAAGTLVSTTTVVIRWLAICF